MEILSLCLLLMAAIARTLTTVLYFEKQHSMTRTAIRRSCGPYMTGACLDKLRGGKAVQVPSLQKYQRSVAQIDGGLI